MVNLLVYLLLPLAALLASPAASASTKSFRCKNDLVNLGDNKASALLKCGEPLVKDAFCKPVDARVVLVPPRGSPGPASNGTTVNTVCETVDEWTYNPGYGQFMTTLRFESGRLVAITYGDRVR